MPQNSRIIYRILATPWLDVQKDIIRRHNVVKEDIRNIQQSRLMPDSTPAQPNPTANTNLYTTWPINKVSNAQSLFLGKETSTKGPHTSFSLQPLSQVPPFTQSLHLPSSISSLAEPKNEPHTVTLHFYPYTSSAQPSLSPYNQTTLMLNHQQKYQVPIKYQPQPSYPAPVSHQQSNIYHCDVNFIQGALNQQGRYFKSPLPGVFFNRQNNYN